MSMIYLCHNQKRSKEGGYTLQTVYVGTSKYKYETHHSCAAGKWETRSRSFSGGCAGCFLFGFFSHFFFVPKEKRNNYL